MATYGGENKRFDYKVKTLTVVDAKPARQLIMKIRKYF